MLVRASGLEAGPPDRLGQPLGARLEAGGGARVMLLPGIRHTVAVIIFVTVIAAAVTVGIQPFIRIKGECILIVRHPVAIAVDNLLLGNSDVAIV